VKLWWEEEAAMSAMGMKVNVRESYLYIGGV
jgi:hypothetical protein